MYTTYNIPVAHTINKLQLYLDVLELLQLGIMQKAIAVIIELVHDSNFSFSPSGLDLLGKGAGGILVTGIGLTLVGVTHASGDEGERAAATWVPRG
jgi:hypothetical protein